ncbi:hypothetical protein STENM327S_06553 [Streptomyces tendae]
MAGEDTLKEVQVTDVQRVVQAQLFRHLVACAGEQRGPQVIWATSPGAA